MPPKDEREKLAEVTQIFNKRGLLAAVAHLGCLCRKGNGISNPQLLDGLPHEVVSAWFSTKSGHRCRCAWAHHAGQPVPEKPPLAAALGQLSSTKPHAPVCAEALNVLNEWHAALPPGVLLLKGAPVRFHALLKSNPAADLQALQQRLIEAAEAWWSRWYQESPEPPEGQAAWERLENDLELRAPLNLTRAKAIMGQRWGLTSSEWGQRLKVFVTARQAQKKDAALARQSRLALARRAREAVAAVQKIRAAYLASLLNPKEACALLGITRHRWNKDVAARLPVAERQEFHKWGRVLQTSLYEPAVVQALVGVPPEDMATVVRPGLLPPRPVDPTIAQRAAAARIKAKATRTYRAQLLAVLPGSPVKQKEVKLPCAVRSVQFSPPLWGTILLEVVINCTRLVSKGPNTGMQQTMVPDPASVARVIQVQWPAVLQRWAEELEGALIRATPGWSDHLRATLRTHARPLIAQLPTPHWPGDSVPWDETVDQGVRALLSGQGSAELRAHLALTDIPGWYPEARALARRWTVWLGPTNSGKTHGAMEALKAAATGVYLAPLRLMALESHERLVEAGLSCGLKTGEEVRVPSGPQTHLAATIEAGLDDQVWAVAVIDEAQMIADPERGGAWTQALLGVAARHLCVCAAPEAESALLALAAHLGEPVEVVRTERATPLTVLPSTVDLSQVEAGDAIVAFSRQQVLGYRAWLRHRGHRVACIYGDLGPEVRQAEAARFRSGAATVLVATDAIGMGLNLPIRRVLFSEHEKFDGESRRRLKGHEWRQIGGRAGRRGFHEQGLVGVLEGCSTQWLLEGMTLPLPPIAAAFSVLPPWSVVQATAAALATSRLAATFSALADLLEGQGMWTGTALRSRASSHWTQMLDACHIPLRLRFDYLGCPVRKAMLNEVGNWAIRHQRGKTVAAPVVPRAAGQTSTIESLAGLEAVSHLITAYLWLALRFPEAYPEGAVATLRQAEVQGVISTLLATKALDRLCSGCGSRLGVAHRFPICDGCHQEQRRSFRPWDDHWD